MQMVFYCSSTGLYSQFLFFILFSQFLSSQFLYLGVDGVDMSHVLLARNEKRF